MAKFVLDERLEDDCLFVMDLPLSRLILMNESRYPWFILVPRIAGLRELIDLDLDQEAQFLVESRQLQTFLRDKLEARKLNVAALGNMVPQLHVHHIARFEEDAAWPAPVWGKFQVLPYEGEEAEALMSSAKEYMRGAKK